MLTPIRAVLTDMEEEANNNINERLVDFNNSAQRVTEQAALGDELALLPGPNINFNDLTKLVITWSASLASSVALYLLVWNAFKAISGTEESRNRLKSTIIQAVIGLALIFFSYQLVSMVMGIIWAS